MTSSPTTAVGRNENLIRDNQTTSQLSICDRRDHLCNPDADECARSFGCGSGGGCLGFWLEVSLTDWCLLTLCISLVIAAEAFNTAVECVVDLVSPQRQELAGRAKDAAAGGVLLTSIGAAVIGAIVFGRRLWPG